MLWVADTGPILHLAEAHAIELLSQLESVVVPPAVVEELSRMLPGQPLPASLEIVALEKTRQQEAVDWHHAGLIDRGEAHAIALVRQIGAGVLLTDDAAARLFASSLAIRAHGSLGVVLWLAGQQRIEIEDAARTLDRLATTSLWLSPRILAEAHATLRGFARG
jgi:predicted nucleic acid-binding protein